MIYSTVTDFILQRGFSVFWCWGNFQSTLAYPLFSLPIISP